MKKQIFLSAILLGACSFMVNAQSQPAAQATASVAQERTEIKPEALPEAVKKTLAGDSFKGWEVAKAFAVKENYEVELKKGTEMKTVKFDKEGKEIK